MKTVYQESRPFTKFGKSISSVSNKMTPITLITSMKMIKTRIIFPMSRPDLTTVCETMERLAIELTERRLRKARITRTVTRARPFPELTGKTVAEQTRKMIVISKTFHAI